MNKEIKQKIYNLIPDKIFLSILFERIFHRKLDWKNPKTFNEKLQWLKIYDHNPLYTNLVDKYKVKEIVARKIGEQYIIPTLGVWNKFDEIDFPSLPERFVLKTTHDSGGVVVCKDKSKLDLAHARQVINDSLHRNFYYMGREWPYKNVPRRIIAERYLENADGTPIDDFKIQCFDGVPDNILVCVDRFCSFGVKYHYFDKDWKYLPYCPYPEITADNVNIQKPCNLEKMLQIATTLSQGFKEVRVDLYNIDGVIYFGELTFFSQDGFDTDITEEADQILGSKLDLPQW